MSKYDNESDSDGDVYGYEVTSIAKAPKIAMKKFYDIITINYYVNTISNVVMPFYIIIVG